MGFGDNLMASGMARGAKQRGAKIAFGDGKRIIWDKHSGEVFKGNSNVALPGAERDAGVEWMPFYKGHRIYNRQDQGRSRWLWNYDFRATPGELFFNTAEQRNAKRYGSGFVIIEPNVPHWKTVAPNKDWGFERYQKVADELIFRGLRVVQFRPEKGQTLRGVEVVKTLSYRDAVGIMGRAKLFIGPEGGLHHAAAAMNRKAVVLFGGFIPPEVTGYDGHANLTGGAEACGNYTPCDHCKQAMAKITVEEVLSAAMERL